jgi:tRNA-Thr(GGU) m(6)t(6)A37 methyltransferase TsaA
LSYEKKIVLKPIGTVKNAVTEVGHNGADSLVSEIIINIEHEEALEGIEQFSHLIIISWMHQVPSAKRHLKKVHPRGRLDLPLRGVLATRTQYRPNPLGVKTVKLLERRGNVLRVMGLDALDGTPILDIKPYDPDYDGAPGATVPKWVESLRQNPEPVEPAR